MLRDIRAMKKEKFLYSLLEKLATTETTRTDLAKLTSFHRSEEDDLDDQEGTEEKPFEMLVHGHSGYLDHKIEKKAADYNLDMRKCVTNDGSRSYQLSKLTPQGTKEQYEAQVKKNPSCMDNMCKLSTHVCINRTRMHTKRHKWHCQLERYTSRVQRIPKYPQVSQIHQTISSSRHGYAHLPGSQRTVP